MPEVDWKAVFAPFSLGNVLDETASSIIAQPTQGDDSYVAFVRRLDDAALRSIETHAGRGIPVHLYHPENLSGISSLRVDEVIVTAAAPMDVTELFDLWPTVSSLTLNGDVIRKGEVELGRFDHVRHLAIEWDALSRGGGAAGPALESLALLGFDAEDISEVRGDGLKSLALYGAKKLVDLESLRNLRGLRELEIYDARRLASIDAVAALPDLTRLELDGCTAVRELEAVRGALRLRRLRVADCGSIASLKPIEGHDRLEALLAWGTTTIEDGDLTPLLSLPNLSALALKSRRHYSPSVSSIERALGVEH